MPLTEMEATEPGVEAPGAGSDDADAESSGSSSDEQPQQPDGQPGEEQPEAKKARKDRDPRAPIPASAMKARLDAALAKLVSTVEDINSRAEGPCRASYHAVIVYDAAEPGNKVFVQGKLLHVASDHFEASVSGDETDASLSRLFKNRLVFSHMNQGDQLSRLMLELEPATTATPATAEAEAEPAAGLIHIIRPVRVVEAGTWEQNMKVAKELMLVHANHLWGTEHGT